MFFTTELFQQRKDIIIPMVFISCYFVGRVLTMASMQAEGRKEEEIGPP